MSDFTLKVIFPVSFKASLPIYITLDKRCREHIPAVVDFTNKNGVSLTGRNHGVSVTSDATLTGMVALLKQCHHM